MKKSELIETKEYPLFGEINLYQSLTDSEINSFGKYYAVKKDFTILPIKGESLEGLKNNLSNHFAKKIEKMIESKKEELSSLELSLESYQTLENKTEGGKK